MEEPSLTLEAVSSISVDRSRMVRAALIWARRRSSFRSFCRSPVTCARSTISLPNWLNAFTNSVKLLTPSSLVNVLDTCPETKERNKRALLQRRCGETIAIHYLAVTWWASTDVLRRALIVNGLRQEAVIFSGHSIFRNFSGTIHLVRYLFFVHFTHILLILVCVPLLVILVLTVTFVESFFSFNDETDIRESCFFYNYRSDIIDPLGIYKFYVRITDCAGAHVMVLVIALLLV